MCLNVFPTCFPYIYVHHMCNWYLLRSEESMESPGTGVMSCEPSCGWFQDTWVLRIKSWFSANVASALNHWAITPALHFQVSAISFFICKWELLKIPVPWRLDEQWGVGEHNQGAWEASQSHLCWSGAVISLIESIVCMHKALCYPSFRYTRHSGACL